MEGGKESFELEHMLVSIISEDRQPTEQVIKTSIIPLHEMGIKMHYIQEADAYNV